MKLKIGDVVYLQKYEIAHIMHNLTRIPYDIIQETFNDDDDDFFCMDGPNDGFWFRCAYIYPKNIEWFMQQDWIIDYSWYAKMPLKELEAIRERLEVECATSIDKFNAKSKAYRKAHFEEKNDAFSKFEHKIASLGYLIDHLKGETTFTFPEGYQDEAATPRSSDEAPCNVSTPSEKPSFFVRLFSRSAQ